MSKSKYFKYKFDEAIISMKLSIRHDPKKPMNQNQLSKNIAKLMERNAISASELARSLRLPYNTIRRITHGSTNDPRISTLQLIADYFGVGLDVLTEKGLATSYSSKNQQVQTVPILSWAALSENNSASNINLIESEERQPIALTSSMNLSEEAYALKSKKSMQPRFPAGTTLIVEPKIDPIDGDLVLIKINTSNAISLRNLIIDPPNWLLLPIIGSSPTLVYNEKEHNIIGVIVLTMFQTRETL